MDRARRWPGGPYCWMMVLSIAGILLVMKIHVSSAVEITKLSVPQYVLNGTEEVILDCEYEYTENDFRLVIKWFLNDDSEALYQWIPELERRHVSAKLQDRINFNYTVTPSNKYTKYRALNIIKPTTELSGKYSCHVVSLASQDSKEQTMLVYAPAKHFDFSYTRVTSTVLNMTCEAEGLYPPPEMILYKLSPGEGESTKVASSVTITNDTDGYRIALVSQVNDNELPADGATTFECVLFIPGTDYRKHKTISYYPGMNPTDGDYTRGPREYGSRTAENDNAPGDGVSGLQATLTLLGTLLPLVYLLL